MTSRAWTPEQDAALLAKLRREDAEFAAWSAGVQSGNITLEGPELAAERAGFRAGLLDLDDNTRRTATSAYSAPGSASGGRSGTARVERPGTATRSPGT